MHRLRCSGIFKILLLYHPVNKPLRQFNIAILFCSVYYIVLAIFVMMYLSFNSFNMHKIKICNLHMNSRSKARNRSLSSIEHHSKSEHRNPEIIILKIKEL